MTSEPWYAAGLRFRCTACGDCCTGDPGAVWLNQLEVSAIAGALALSVAEVEASYLRGEAGRRSLREREGGDCVLLDAGTRRCRVYQARPTQCRTWPFWEANLVSPRAWEEVCGVCPGSGDGELWEATRIEQQVIELRLARRKG